MTVEVALLHRLPQPPRRVAVLRPGRMGDFLCATPALRALRHALPGAEIIFIALPYAEELVARSRVLDRFACFPGFPGIAEQFFEARRCTSFLDAMQRQEFDLAIQLYGSGAYSNPFALLLGARFTAGFVSEGEGPGRLDAAYPWRPGLHEIRRLLEFVEFLGAPARGEQTEFPLWPQDHSAADLLLSEARPPLIGVHASAMDQTRQWPAERFAAAANLLQDEIGGTIVAIGGEPQQRDAHKVASLLHGPWLDLSGKTSVAVLGAVIARLNLLLTNDSGPAHLAYALGTPAVTIFGATQPEIWGPLTPAPARLLAHPVPCRPCGAPDCSIGYQCLAGVSAAQAAEAGLDLLRRSRYVPSPLSLWERGRG
jgi:ADP-heptose:LPS heptosyltransferase